MPGAALTKVEEQISVIKGYADASLAAAESALSKLTNINFPYRFFSYSFPEFTTFTPAAASLPADIVVDIAPIISNLVVPTKPNAPTYADPTLGTMYPITLPDVPTVVFPSLDITPPVYSVSPPTAWSFTVGDVIITNDPMVQAVLARLTANINTGGTGLSAAVEAAIWARGLEREEQQLNDSVGKATSMWAKKGFSLPDGELANSLMALQTEYMNRSLDRSREIEIKQAELEQANLFKSMELAVNLAATLINMLIRYEELVFRGQEATAKFANEYIDIQIKAYASQVEGYKAQAAVYESLIRAELAKVEVYKTQIEGQKLINEVNKQTVEVYSEKLKAISIYVERYKTEVQTMVAELEIERAKIEANKLQFDSWAKQADVNIAKYNGAIDLYKAESLVNISTAEMQSKQIEAQVRAGISEVEVGMKFYEITDREIMLKAQIVLEAAKGVADATARMAAGAMSAMSAQASMSYGETMQLEEA